MKTKRILNFRCRRVLIFASFALVLVLAISFAGSGQILPVSAQVDEVSITLSPASGSINGCETVTVEVWLNDVIGFYGADVRMSFDPSVLQVVDSDVGQSGVQIAAGDFWTPGFVVFNSADNTAGTITYAATQLNPTPEVDGSGVILEITFQAISTGSSSLSFTFTKISDRNGVEIPAPATGGSLSTSAPASPSLAISKLNATDVRMSWNAIIGSNIQYRLYRDTAAYFTPVAPAHQTTSSTSYDDLSALGDIYNNYFYVLRAECESGFQSNNTNRVGEFDYGVAPGAVGSHSWNAIAVPLDVGAITADGVANYVDPGGSISQVGRWDSGSQSWVFRVVGSPFPPASYPVNTGDPLLILADDTAPLSFAWTGEVPSPDSISFPLTQNQWHFVMIPLDQNPTVVSSADALATAIQAGSPTSSMQVGQWDASSQSWIFRVVGSPFPPANYDVNLGYPYLILTNSATPAQWP